MTPTEYLEAEFRRYFPDANEIDVAFNDDETIDVDVVFDHPRSYNFRMEIGSDDDFYVFTEVSSGMIVTVPLMPESDYASFADPSADAVEVEVWNYASQDFFPSIRCPGERRVRVDYYGPLSDLAVFKVTRIAGRGFMVQDGNGPLEDWHIDWS
jgi:hypothetical protein